MCLCLPPWGEKGGGGVLLKWLVTLELGLKAHPVSKEMGREEAFPKRGPPEAFLTGVLHAVK